MTLQQQEYENSLKLAGILLEEVERIGCETGQVEQVAFSKGRKAQVFRDGGDLDSAIALLEEQERISRELGNQNGLQASLGNQGLRAEQRVQAELLPAFVPHQVLLQQRIISVMSGVTLVAAQVHSGVDINGQVRVHLDQAV